jgi:hypothetical protein
MARLRLACVMMASLLGMFVAASAVARMSSTPSLTKVARCLRAAHWKATVTNADGAHFITASVGRTTWMIAFAYGKFNELPSGHPATAKQRATIARCTMK